MNRLRNNLKSELVKFKLKVKELLMNIPKLEMNLLSVFFLIHHWDLFNSLASDEINSRLREVRNKTEYALRELRGQEEVNLKNINEVTNLKEQIAHLQLEINREEARKKNMEGINFF